MALFESYERRIPQITAVLAEYGIASIEEAKAICDAKGVDPYTICKETQPIAFENAAWAYVVGAAIAFKKGTKKASEAAEAIGIGLQAFCIPGSVADDRKVGIGHGNLAAMLLREETECFAFLAGHESFAAAEGAIKIAQSAGKVRTSPLRVILNGLVKTRLLLFLESTDLPTFRRNLTMQLAKCLSLKRSLIPMETARKFVATVRTTFAKALQSCIWKVLMCQSRATRQTRPVSSILLLERIRRNATILARSTSLLHQAAAQAVRFTPIIWRQVLPPMV